MKWASVWHQHAVLLFSSDWGLKDLTSRRGKPRHWGPWTTWIIYVTERIMQIYVCIIRALLNTKIHSILNSTPTIICGTRCGSEGSNIQGHKRTRTREETRGCMAQCQRRNLAACTQSTALGASTCVQPATGILKMIFASNSLPSPPLYLSLFLPWGLVPARPISLDEGVGVEAVIFCTRPCQTECVLLRKSPTGSQIGLVHGLMSLLSLFFCRKEKRTGCGQCLASKT